MLQDTECLEISSIRDTRVGKYAKEPKVSNVVSSFKAYFCSFKLVARVFVNILNRWSNIAIITFLKVLVNWCNCMHVCRDK